MYSRSGLCRSQLFGMTIKQESHFGQFLTQDQFKLLQIYCDLLLCGKLFHLCASLNRTVDDCKKADY